MPRQQKTFDNMYDCATVRTIEVRGTIPGCLLEDGASLTARWERWDGKGTADADSEPDGSPLRPDYELALGFFGFGNRASWGTGTTNSEEFALLSGTNLTPQVIRAYGMLLLELAARVEAAAEADSAADREHERTMRRRTLKRA